MHPTLLECGNKISLGTTMINTMEESSSEEEEEKEEDIIAVSTSLEPSCGDYPG